MSNKLVTLIDKENSMYVGDLVAERGDHLVIKNPVGIAYPRSADQGVSIALIPIVFNEFLSEKTQKEGIYLNFYTSNLKWYGDRVEFHPDFIAKYENIFQSE